MNHNLTLKETKQIILSEGIEDNLKVNLKKLYDFTVEIIRKSEKYYNLNVRFLVTWGASLGGMILPLKQWIEGQYPELSEKQIILLLVGISCNYFYDNEKFLKGVLDRIKDEGLLPYFKKLFEKAEEFKNGFLDFMTSVTNLSKSMTLMVSYAFILPILDDIIKLSNAQDIETTLNFLVQRIVASGVVMVGGMTLVNFLRKLIEHFKTK